AQSRASADPTEPAENTTGKYQVGDRVEASKTPVDDGGARTVEWDDLVPESYDPYVILEGANLDAMEDNDPRANALLEELKASWANAPVVDAMDGQRIRIPGFIVPLEGDEKNVNEMLLVPYFGACIHVPPPPSNQIIHVPEMPPVNRDIVYEAVWVEGTLHTQRAETEAGAASYSLKADSVTLYE
ncbi:MAG: DUF3299 domain-containing protein, partial [Gammaproteobacteria bacterium]